MDKSLILILLIFIISVNYVYAINGLTFSTLLDRKHPNEAYAITVPNSLNEPARYEVGDKLFWNYSIINRKINFRTSVCFYLKDLKNDKTYDLTEKPILENVNKEYCENKNPQPEDCPIKLSNRGIGITNDAVKGNIFTYTFLESFPEGTYELITQLREPNIGCSNPDGSINNAVPIAEAFNYFNFRNKERDRATTTLDLCNNFYRGTIFDGFCFANINDPYITKNEHDGVYSLTSDDYNILVYYPQSIETDIEYPLKIKISNKKLENLPIRIHKIATGFGESQQKQINQVINILPRETKEFELKGLSPSNPTLYGSITIYASIDNIENFNLFINRIIILKPNLELRFNLLFAIGESIERADHLDIKMCGQKRYNDKTAVCQNNILYPTMYKACFGDEDCVDRNPDGTTTRTSECIANTCYGRSGIYKDALNREYNVEIIPIYINVYGDSSNPKKIESQERINKIVSDMNKWFDDEKKYWNYQGNWNIKWSSSNMCSFNSLQEYIRFIHQYSSESDIIEGIISRCGSPNKDMHGSVTYWSIDNPSRENPDLRPLFDEVARFGEGFGGSNYGNYFDGIAKMDTLIHETLHSFGENDIHVYPDSIIGGYGQFYQWNNCIVYGVNNDHSHLWEQETKPHLCILEAKAIRLV